MTDPFVAEIRILACNFPPTGWAFCDGQILPISQNTALFSLLGTTYGGDGRSNFALPNLQGAIPMGQGQGPGLSQQYLGEQSGEDHVTLINSEMPVHTHTLMASNEDGDLNTPAPQRVLGRALQANTYAPASGNRIVQMHPQAVGVAGGSQPHNNLQPYLTLNFCIALQGIYPARS